MVGKQMSVITATVIFYYNKSLKAKAKVLLPQGQGHN